VWDLRLERSRATDLALRPEEIRQAILDYQSGRMGHLA